MDEQLAELCVNVWCTIDQRSGLVCRIAARAYALRCSDKLKGQVLKVLARADIHLADELQLLSNFRTTIIDDAGRQLKVPGIFPDNVDTNLPTILDMVCKELERRIPSRFVADAANPRSAKMQFGKEPYYVLTFLSENESGELSIVGA